MVLLQHNQSHIWRNYGTYEREAHANRRISDYRPGLHSLQWRHDGHDSISNHQPHNCLLNRLFRRISKITSKLRVTGLSEGNSPEFAAQMASNAENVSIWWWYVINDDENLLLKLLGLQLWWKGAKKYILGVFLRFERYPRTLSNLQQLRTHCGNRRTFIDALHQKWKLYRIYFWMKDIDLCSMIISCSAGFCQYDRIFQPQAPLSRPCAVVVLRH